MLLAIPGIRQRQSVIGCLLGELRVMWVHVLKSATARATRSPSMAALTIPPA